MAAQKPKITHEIRDEIAKALFELEATDTEEEKRRVASQSEIELSPITARWTITWKTAME